MLLSRMSNAQKISIALTPELNQVVQEAVKSGQYATASEVMRDALRLWQNKEKLKQEGIEYMRALIQEGIDSGPGRELDFDELKAEMHAELARRKDARRVA